MKVRYPVTDAIHEKLLGIVVDTSVWESEHHHPWNMVGLV